MKRTILFFLQFYFCFIYLGICQPCSGNYPARLTEEFISQRFSTSVIHIRNKKNTNAYGQGYIIDVKRGLIVTAAHVVEDLKKANNENPIILGYSSFFERPIELSILKNNSELGESNIYDLALLEPSSESDLTILKNVSTEVDFAIDYPDLNEELYGLLFLKPFSSEPTIRKFKYRTQAKTEDNFILQIHGEDIYRGYSGGMILNNKGFLVGTLVEQSFSTSYSGNVIPSYYHLEFLEEIEPSKRLLIFDSNLKKGVIEPEEIVSKLRYVSGPSNLSNIDLVKWSNMVTNNLKDYRELLDERSCIEYSYGRRFLDYFADNFRGLNNQNDYELGKWYVRKARRLPRTSISQKLIDLKIAESLYIGEIVNFVRENPTYILEACKLTGLSFEVFKRVVNNPIANKITFSNDKFVKNVVKTNYFSSIFKEFAELLQLRSTIIADPVLRRDLIERSLFFLAFSEVFTEKDSKPKIYELTGDVFQSLFQQDYAAFSFARAWQNDTGNSGVMNKWKESIEVINARAENPIYQSSIKNFNSNIDSKEVSNFIKNLAKVKYGQL